MPRNRHRPAIPVKTQLKLWTLSAGRCEFLGCNEMLWRDSLTFSEGNYSNVAHIVSWTPSGPRGDAIQSSRLAQDITNLMLVCQRHGKLIDEQQNISKYSVERLKSFKLLHEARIEAQTNIKESRKTTVVRLQSNLRGRRVEIPASSVYTALIEENRYPSDEKGLLLDLTGLDYMPDSSFWSTASKQIKTGLDRGLSRGNDELEHSHLSVFGLAPIPLLVYFGYRLGNTVPADIYVKPRNLNWRLSDGSPRHRHLQIRARFPRQLDKEEIALSIEISGTNSAREIERAVGKRVPVVVIQAAKPGLDTITSADEFEAFRKVYRSTLDAIRTHCGKKATVHLLVAVPSCVAIVCGRELLYGVDPALVVYEHGDQSSGFFRAIKVN